MSDKDDNLLSHPEVKKILKEGLASIVSESDRGAVLISAEIINSHLEKLFKQKTSASNNLLKKLLAYPGPLSSFSAKMDVAYAVDYIDENLYSSIKILRQVRNKAAHSKSSFDLGKQKNRLIKILEIGPNIPAAISEMASELLVHNLVDRIWKNQKEENPEVPIFESKEEVFNAIAQHDEAIQELENMHPRTMLGIGTALITGSIIYSMENHN